MASKSWGQLNSEIVACQKCERLVTHCQKTAVEKRRSYREWDYWGKPVPNMGPKRSDLLIVGLAPGAHGANRTGRMFTGDRSGDWLFRALHRAGFASQAESESIDDGLRLIGCAITAICHCAPPLNKPTADEVEECRPFLDQTFKMTKPKVVLALGQIAWKGSFSLLRRHDLCEGPLPKFAHGACFKTKGPVLLGSYHPSQQNTFTGRLTEPMLDSVFESARRLIDA